MQFLNVAMHFWIENKLNFHVQSGRYTKKASYSQIEAIMCNNRFRVILYLRMNRASPNTGEGAK